jgi:uncharacterized glyoxalase superfamily protein PhnB
MSPESVRPAGSPWVIPYLTVKDAAKALDFYQRAFGFTKKNAMADKEGRVLHGEMEYRDAWIMLGPEGGLGNQCRTPATSGNLSPMSLYIYCDDVDALFARATAAGAKGDVPPSDMFWGDRMCKVTDPDGHAWSFATHTGKTAPPPF